MIFSAFWTGVIAAVIMAIWIGVAAKWQLLKVHQLGLLGHLVLGRGATAQAAALVGILPHLLVGGLIGAVYGWLMENGIFFAGPTALSALAFTVVPWLVMELAVLPVLGEGVFGHQGEIQRSAPTWFAIHALYAIFLVYFFSLIAA